MHQRHRRLERGWHGRRRRAGRRRLCPAHHAVGCGVRGAARGIGGRGGHAGPGKTTVNFWQRQFEDYQQDWFKKQIDAFNASQDAIQVVHTVVPGDAWDAKLAAAQAAGTQPDVVTTNYGGIRPGTVNGQFAKLDDLMDASVFADIQEYVKPFVTVDGAHLRLPDARRAVDRPVLPQGPVRGRRTRSGGPAQVVGRAPDRGAGPDQGRRVRHEHRPDRRATSAGPAGVSSTTRPATCRSPTTGPPRARPTRSSSSWPSSTRRSSASSSCRRRRPTATPTAASSARAPWR